jgi:hypothetical protein
MYKNNAFIFLITLGFYAPNIHSMELTAFDMSYGTIFDDYGDDFPQFLAGLHAATEGDLPQIEGVPQTTAGDLFQENFPRFFTSHYKELLEILLIANKLYGVPRDCCKFLGENFICQPSALWDAFGTPLNDFDDCDLEAIRIYANPLTVNYHKENGESCLDYLLEYYKNSPIKTTAKRIIDVFNIILPHGNGKLITNTNRESFLAMTYQQQYHLFLPTEYKTARELISQNL